MQKVLLVTVRLHEGRYHGRDDTKALEWPPAPARVFQAMVAGVARGGSIPLAAAETLDWLETLPPPVVAAPCGTPGAGFDNFVPNNDLDATISGKNLDEAVAKTRVGKSVRPTLFDDRIPIIYKWTIGDAGIPNQATLRELVHGIYQLGRSVDMAWANAAILPSDEADRQLSGWGGILYKPTVGGESGHYLLCPRPGFRKSLSARFDGMTSRLRVSEGRGRGSNWSFVQAPRPLVRKVCYDSAPHRFLFELRRPSSPPTFAAIPLADAADLVETARNRAASHLRAGLPGLREQVDRLLVGRGARDSDKGLRVRIVPIPSIGHKYVDMNIRRLMVLVPQACPLSPADVFWAFSKVVWRDDDDVIVRELHQAVDDRMASRYEGWARRWRSVTALALTKAQRRRIDPQGVSPQVKGGPERVAEEKRAAWAVAQSARHAEVSVQVARVVAQREPLDLKGERAEKFARRTRFNKHAMWHSTVTFSDKVPGPCH